MTAFVQPAGEQSGAWWADVGGGFGSKIYLYAETWS